MKSERDGINPAAKPSGTGCVDARLEADGGSIFADVPNAVTSVVVIVHRVSMHQNTTALRVTR